MKGLAKGLLSLVVLAAVVVFAGCGNPWMKRITASLYDKPGIPEVPGQTASDKAITGFKIITSPVSVGVIDEAAKTIAVTVPYGTVVTGLVPSITYIGASVSPASDVAQDFTDPVTYTVTAADGSTVTYTVTVTVSSVLSSVEDVAAYLAAATGGTTPGSPIILPLVEMNLSGSGWADLLWEIYTAGKYVSLDLSACGMSGTEFNPGTANTGERYITALTLPDAAASIVDGPYISPFQYFDVLESVSGDNVTDIGNSAFRDCTSLTSVAFPKATDIVYYAFFGCNNLPSVDLPEATDIGPGAFQNCTSLTSVNLPKATSIDTQAFRNTGTMALTVTLGATPPRLGSNIFTDVTSPKTVTVKVPTAALSAYGPVPVNTTDSNWGNAFRGKGWIGGSYLAGTVNGSVSLAFTTY